MAERQNLPRLVATMTAGADHGKRGETLQGQGARAFGKLTETVFGPKDEERLQIQTFTVVSPSARSPEHRKVHFRQPQVTVGNFGPPRRRGGFPFLDVPDSEFGAKRSSAAFIETQ